MSVLEIVALAIGFFVLGIIALYVFALVFAVLVVLMSPKRRPRDKQMFKSD